MFGFDFGWIPADGLVAGGKPIKKEEKMNACITNVFFKMLILMPLVSLATSSWTAEPVAVPGTSHAVAVFQLPPLPYAHDALEPYVSARTMSFYYGKHQQAYIDTLNKLVAGTPWA